jgi:hypothetical protein
MKEGNLAAPPLPISSLTWSCNPNVIQTQAAWAASFQVNLLAMATELQSPIRFLPEVVSHVEKTSGQRQSFLHTIPLPIESLVTASNSIVRDGLFYLDED